jgi:hypothetical protein
MPALSFGGSLGRGAQDTQGDDDDDDEEEEEKDEEEHHDPDASLEQKRPAPRHQMYSHGGEGAE